MFSKNKTKNKQMQNEHNCFKFYDHTQNYANTQVTLNKDMCKNN